MSGKRVKVDTVLARSLTHFLLRSAFPICLRRLVGEGAKMNYRPYWASCPNACLASCPNACLASCHNSSSRVSEV